MASHWESCRFSTFVQVLILISSINSIAGNRVEILPAAASYETNSYYNAKTCDQSQTVSWDVLKLYRVQNKDVAAQQVLETLSPNSSNLDQVKCRYSDDTIIRLTVLALNDEVVKSKQDSPSYFSSDGHFHHDYYTFKPDEYCVESITPEKLTILTCNYASYWSYCTNHTSNDLIRKPCLFRCCDYGEVWDVSGPKLRCADSGSHKWKMIPNNGVTGEKDADDDGPIILSMHPSQLIKTCKAKYTFLSQSPKLKNDKRFGNRPFRIFPNGTVLLKLRRQEWVELSPGEYCADGIQHGEGNFTGNPADLLLFECKVLETEAEVEDMKRQRTYSFSFGIIIMFCLLFLLITAVVYILLWSKHNIHGWTVFSYIITLLITYILLGASHFATVALVHENMPGKMDILSFCGLLGVVCHFSFLCTFSWSTVLSFDLFCTFRTLRPRRSGKSNGRRKFLLYCLFAIIVPSCIVATGIFLDIMYSEDVHSDVIRPKYGKSVCYVEPRDARAYYVILPIAVLLVINFLLFCNTAYSVYKVKKSTRFASSSSTKGESGRQTLRLILKLLLINGVVWIVEIISWYLQDADNQVGLVSFVLDIVNIMQAVAIFFLFVFKKDILEALKRKYPSLEGTVDVAFKLRKLGRVKNFSRSTTTTRTTSTNISGNVKTKQNEPVSKL